MTTRQLAEKLDIVPATVVMYENGKHPIPYDVAIKLADVLEIETSLDKGTQRKTTENELPSLTQCTA